MTGLMERTAVFDNPVVRTYRYNLGRGGWGGTGRVCWIMLNPSFADEKRDDATIKKCIGYATRWGRSRIVVVNLFAFISTNPAALKVVKDPIGPDNDRHIVDAVQTSDEVVAAWGEDGNLFNRAAAVRRLLGPVKLLCLGTTKAGAPKHPGRIAYDTRLVELK
jgi:hypothetical protein